MKRKGGGLLGLGAGVVNAGLDYEAYKNSNSFLGMIGLRLYYGLLIIAIPLSVLGIIWLLFGKVTPANKNNSTTKPPA